MIICNHKNKTYAHFHRMTMFNEEDVNGTGLIHDYDKLYEYIISRNNDINYQTLLCKFIFEFSKGHDIKDIRIYNETFSPSKELINNIGYKLVKIYSFNKDKFVSINRVFKRVKLECVIKRELEKLIDFGFNFTGFDFVSDDGSLEDLVKDPEIYCKLNKLDNYL